MQNFAGTSGREAGADARSRGRKSRPPRRAPKTENHGTEPRHTHFLTQALTPISPKSETATGGDNNLITRENYLFLRDSARNYARLLERDLGREPAGDLGMRIAALYAKVAELEPSLNLNMQLVDDRLHFVFWHEHNCPSCALFWPEVKFLESLTPRMRAVTLLFFQKLGLPTMNNDCDTDMVLEWLSDGAEEDIAAAKSYRTGGKAYKLMREIEEPPSPEADLAAMLATVRPRKPCECALLEVLKEGLRFTESQNIFDYDYRYCGDDNYQDFIDLQRIIRFVYDDDAVRENLIDMMNCELQSDAIGCTPCSSLRITPQTRERFTPGTFPEEFLGWMDKLINCTNCFQP